MDVLWEVTMIFLDVSSSLVAPSTLKTWWSFFKIPEFAVVPAVKFRMRVAIVLVGYYILSGLDNLSELLANQIRRNNDRTRVGRVYNFIILNCDTTGWAVS
jgi:hypothetical protein